MGRRGGRVGEVEGGVNQSLIVKTQNTIAVVRARRDNDFSLNRREEEHFK
jgi:hypothetical protein